MELSPELYALIESLRREIAELRLENAALTEEVASLRHETASLKQEVAGLKRQLGQDSHNSSKPPSSGGLGKKPRIAGILRGCLGVTRIQTKSAPSIFGTKYSPHYFVSLDESPPSRWRPREELVP